KVAGPRALSGAEHRLRLSVLGTCHARSSRVQAACKGPSSARPDSVIERTSPCRSAGRSRDESYMTTDQIAGQYTYLSFADELRALLPGKVVVPGDAGWEAARTPWIVNVDQQPRAVVNVTDAIDIVTVVRFAYDCGLT